MSPPSPTALRRRRSETRHHPRLHRLHWHQRVEGGRDIPDRMEVVALGGEQERRRQLVARVAETQVRHVAVTDAGLGPAGPRAAAR